MMETLKSTEFGTRRPAVAALLLAMVFLAAPLHAGTLRQPPPQPPPSPPVGKPLTQPTLKVDPSSLQVSAGLNFLPPVDNTKVTHPAPVKQGAMVPLSCTWKAVLSKPTSVPAPIEISIVISDVTGTIVHLKKESASIKAGEYSFPGQVAQGTVDVMWKPGGLGINEASCIVAATNQAWWGQGSLPMAKQNRKVQVEPDKFKVCPTWYPVQIGKSPKGDQSGAAGTVAPQEVMLNFDYSLSSASQFVCHYKSQNGDIKGVTLTVPCPGAKLLPQQTGQMLKMDRYFCND